MRLARLAPGQSADAWRTRLAQPQPGLTLKRDAGVHVLRTPDGYVLKSQPLTSRRRRLEFLLGFSRAHRHWRGSLRLAALGLPTARCLALARTPDAAVLAMDALPGRSVLEHLSRRDLPVRDEHAVARALGALARTLVDAGRFNRDAKPSNLIVLPPDPPADGPAAPGRPGRSVATIDCVAIRRCPRRSGRHLARTLASMIIEPIGCACPPRRALRLRAVRSALGDHPDRRAVRELWRAVERLVAEHPDPRPRVSPLSGV